MQLIRKSFCLSEGTEDMLKKLVIQSITNRAPFSEGAIVRLALEIGLPIVASRLNLDPREKETDQDDLKPQTV